MSTTSSSVAYRNVIASRRGVDAGELLAGAEGLVEDGAGGDVPHPGAHEGAALARLDVLEVDDRVASRRRSRSAMPLLNWLVDTTSAIGYSLKGGVTGSARAARVVRPRRLATDDTGNGGRWRQHACRWPAGGPQSTIRNSLGVRRERLAAVTRSRARCPRSARRPGLRGRSPARRCRPCPRPAGRHGLPESRPSWISRPTP